MKNILIKLITGKMPRLKVAVVAGVAWLISYLITKFGLQIGEDTRAEINNYVAGGVWLVIEMIAAKLGLDSVKSIQRELPAMMPDVAGHDRAVPSVTVDGYALPDGETVNAVKALREAADVPPPIEASPTPVTSV